MLNLLCESYASTSLKSRLVILANGDIVFDDSLQVHPHTIPHFYCVGMPPRIFGTGWLACSEGFGLCSIFFYGVHQTFWVNRVAGAISHTLVCRSVSGQRNSTRRSSWLCQLCLLDSTDSTRRCTALHVTTGWLQ